MRFPEDEEHSVRLMERSHHGAMSGPRLRTYLEVLESHHMFKCPDVCL